MYINTVYKLEQWQIFQEKKGEKNLCQVLTVIVSKRKLCIQWRLYICNVTIQISSMKLKKNRQHWEKQHEGENKLKKNMAIKLKIPTELFK